MHPPLGLPLIHSKYPACGCVLPAGGSVPSPVATVRNWRSPVVGAAGGGCGLATPRVCSHGLAGAPAGGTTLRRLLYLMHNTSLTCFDVDAFLSSDGGCPCVWLRRACVTDRVLGQPHAALLCPPPHRPSPLNPQPTPTPPTNSLVIAPLCPVRPVPTHPFPTHPFPTQPFPTHPVPANPLSARRRDTHPLHPHTVPPSPHRPPAPPTHPPTTDALFVGHPAKEAARLGPLLVPAGGVEAMPRAALLAGGVLPLFDLVLLCGTPAGRLDLLTIEPKGRLRSHREGLRECQGGRGGCCMPA
jgi:hypothetical protein